MVYVALFVALALIRYQARKSKKAQRTWYWILLIGLFCFSAFRYEVGNDWSGYLNVFNIQRWQSLEDALFERNPGYWAANDLVHTLGLPYPFVHVISSAVFFAGFHVLARRQPDPLGMLVLAFPVLIINMPMSAAKQAMAIGLLCVALTAYLDRRLNWFVLWILLGATFHTSVIVFLLLVPLVTGDVTRERLFVAFLFALPGLYALATSSEAEVMEERYIDRSKEAAGAVFRVGLLLLTAAFFFVKVRAIWRRLFPKDYRLAVLGALMMLAAFPLVAVSTVIADRFGYYLMPIQLMMFARFSSVFPHDKSKRLYAAAPYFGLLLLFAVWTHYSWHFKIGYLPYQTWLFGFPD